MLLIYSVHSGTRTCVFSIYDSKLPRLTMSGVRRLPAMTQSGKKRTFRRPVSSSLLEVIVNYLLFLTTSTLMMGVEKNPEMSVLNKYWIVLVSVLTWSEALINAITLCERRSENKFTWRKISQLENLQWRWVYQGHSLPSEPFPALKQNHVGYNFEVDREVETVVTRQLITHDTNWYRQRMVKFDRWYDKCLSCGRTK
jgi:hypothetical protein